ncbi:MAG: multidrug MFS transporter [Nitrospirae bacterium]|nr:multidrug MFS transporter [Nitrospirota bacterium]
MTTFVSVGNATQPFDRLIEAVLRIASRLPQPVIVQHGNTLLQCTGCISRPFMEMTEFSQHVEKAELLILHAGAGSVIQAIQAGKVPVVMPRRAKYGEHVDDHQLEFARALAEMGKVVVAEEPEDLIIAIEEARKRQGMAHALNKRPPLVDLIDETLREYAKTFEKATTQD